MMKEAERLGWVFTRTTSHIRGKHKDGVRLVTISPKSPDRHAIHNARKDLGL